MSQSLSDDEASFSDDNNDAPCNDEADEDIMNKCREQLRSLKSGVISTNNDSSMEIDDDMPTDDGTTSNDSSVGRQDTNNLIPVGDRKPITPPEAFQGLTNEEYDLFWQRDNKGTPYLPNQEKITFYSCSFANKTCEVEWNKEGYIETVQFKVAEQKRRRKQSTQYVAQPKEPRKNKKKLEKCPANADNKCSRVDRKPPPSKRMSATTTRAKEQISTGCKTAAAAPHYITTTLNATREDILASLPLGMVDSFNDCCFALYGGGGIHRPVLILSPFDVTGDGEIVKQWVNRYQQYLKTGQMPHLVYWYEQGWSKAKGFKAFSLISKNHIFSVELAIEKGYDKPFTEKIEDPVKYGLLTPEEDDIRRGIVQLKDDIKRPKGERGGPMFFPHLVENEEKEYNKRMKDLEQKYDNYTQTEKYIKCTSYQFSDRKEGSQMDSLELCAGSEHLSNALSAVGFTTITLDNDLKNRQATSQLSLDQLEEMIINQHTLPPYLDKRFSIIWSGPECRTWSRAGSGTYRNKSMIDGFVNRAYEKDACQARRDIESLVNILSYYKTSNPLLIMVIENPEGYLKHHPVSTLFSTVLGLTEVTISYCRWSTETDKWPEKHTNLWTNSSLLISHFGGDRYKCKSDSICFSKGLDGRHTVLVQDLKDKCSAYPPRMCQFIAGQLYSEMAIKDTACFTTLHPPSVISLKKPPSASARASSSRKSTSSLLTEDSELEPFSSSTSDNRKRRSKNYRRTSTR